MNHILKRVLPAVVAALCVAGAFPAAVSAAADPGAGGTSPSTSPIQPPDLRPPAASGVRAVGLRFFRLEPASADTVYRLLTIPVRFPEDADLGATPGELAARLNGEDPASLAGYWSAATYGRIRFEVTVAPVVTAAHSRPYYTSEGAANTGYGIDPEAYPHNSQGLVAEVTAALADRVDFRRYDNTGDGIADGILILHSGPAAPERIDPELPRTVMLAHAFTLPRVATRGAGTVFPYAVVSARDPIGPWAHETGHLLGLVDLYVSNSLCPGEGLGEWSLMATGANRDGGRSPTGLDALSREILGFAPAYAPAAGPLAVTGGAFARVFRAGEARGSSYFLVERRNGADGLPMPGAATLILYVNEAAVDNRNCLHLLAAVRAAACAGSGSCDEVLTDDTAPDLRDGDGNPTGLVLRASGDGVTVSYAGGSPLRLESVRLLDPRDSGKLAARVQPLAITVRNLSDVPRVVTLAVAPRAAGALCAAAEGTPELGTIPAGGTATDTSWVLLACAGAGAVPETTETFEVSAVPVGAGPAATDTLALAAGGFGLRGDRLAAFTAVNLAAPRRNPWSWDGSAWRATDIRPLADAEIVSPWFTVPENATLVVDHGWTLDALAPDAALDAGRVEIEDQTGSKARLLPPGGWGFTAERGTGNALGGLEVLSGDGDRIQVIDLTPYGRRTVRLAFRAAGDVDLSDSRWVIRGARVLASPPVSFALSEAPAGSRRFLAVANGEVKAGTGLTLYGGRLAVTTTGLIATIGASEVDTFQAPSDPWLRRFELVWIDAQGRGGTGVLTTGPPIVAGPALVAAPNPFHRGNTQTWSAILPEGSAGGRFVFQVIDVAGRRRAERGVVIAVPGPLSVVWDGRDGEGRELAAGVYFLRMARPDGRTAVRRILVLP